MVNPLELNKSIATILLLLMRLPDIHPSVEATTDIPVLPESSPVFSLAPFKTIELLLIVI